METLTQIDIRNRQESITTGNPISHTDWLTFVLVFILVCIAGMGVRSER